MHGPVNIKLIKIIILNYQIWNVVPLNTKKAYVKFGL
jgi:hypothetical protein